MHAIWRSWMVFTVSGSCWLSTAMLSAQDLVTEYPDPVAETVSEIAPESDASTGSGQELTDTHDVGTASENSDNSTDTQAEEAERELVKERYKNGNIKVEREVTLDEKRNYINHGTWASWNEAGEMTARGHFRFGKPHGDSVRWYENVSGKLFSDPLFQGFEKPFRGELTLRNGQLHGTWQIYDNRDRLASSWEFVHNVREGRSAWYHPNGQIAREVTFHGGQLDGELSDRDAEGNVTKKIVFVNGRELAKDIQTRSDGTKVHEGWVLKSHLIENPKYEWWKADVTTTAAATKSEDLRPGKWIFWHANGERRATGEYALGKKTAEWSWWYDNTQRHSRGSFDNNMQVGEWIWWHENGHRHTVGTFTNGEATGVWSSWDTEGRLTQLADYSPPVIDETPMEKAVVESTPPQPVEEVPLPDLQALRNNLSTDETILR